jgi:hypothetical protein
MKLDRSKKIEELSLVSSLEMLCKQDGLRYPIITKKEKVHKTSTSHITLLLLQCL